MINVDAIQSNLVTGNIILLDEVDSTNDYAKKNSLRHGDVVIALKQTAGKGRLGRQWNSDGGIALTVCVQPEEITENVAVLSLVFATAVCEVIRENFNIDCMIKWPNDIVVNSKKLCGILTEAVTENNKITKIVCGAGINIYNEMFDGELTKKATSLYLEGQKNVDINKMTADIVNKFISYKLELPETFKTLCLTVGKKVTVVKPNECYEATAIDVSDDGCLIVKTSDGATVKVMSGEVSVRGIYGYV